MDIDITSVEIPDLSPQIRLSSFKPHFNGNYSSVYQATFQDQLVAVKVIKEIPGALVHTIERKLKRERTTWALLRHPNILPLLGFANSHELFEPFGALVSPWRAQGNACVFLKDRGKELTKDQRLNMWKGVVEGVQYLHNHAPVLVHGNLKLANVMIDDQYSPQICDFGLVSIFLEEGHSGMTTTSQYTGTDRYLAYELLCDEDTVIPTVASDIFALGCIGLEFYFLQTPYANRRNNMQGRIFADIRAGIRPATPHVDCDPQCQQIWDIVGKCWEHNPSERPSAGDLLAALQSQGNKTQLPKRRNERLKLTRTMRNYNFSWRPPRTRSDGTEASSSNMFYQVTTSLGLATPANVYANTISPQSHPQQWTPGSNHSGSPAYVGTSLAEDSYSPDALGSTYIPPSHSPLGRSIDSISAYVPQRSAYSELPMPTAPQQGNYGRVSMPYTSSPLRDHLDPHGMASVHRTLPLSPQGDVDVGVPLRRQVTNKSHLSRPDRRSSLPKRKLGDTDFDGGLHLTSPGTQPLVPTPHYNQREQTGAGLPMRYAYNKSHQLSPSTNMAPPTSSSAYIAPSQPPSRTLGALSSVRSNGRDQILSAMPYPPPQRVIAPTHGFADNGGYLYAQWSGSHSVGGASPTQSTMSHDRIQAPPESMMAYQARGSDGFETPNPDFGWSAHSGNPHTTLSANPQSKISYNSDLQLVNAWAGSLNF